MRSFFTLKISCKTSPGWLQLVFHFGTENRADQLKKPPCRMYLTKGAELRHLLDSRRVLAPVKYAPSTSCVPPAMSAVAVGLIDWALTRAMIFILFFLNQSHLRKPFGPFCIIRGSNQGFAVLYLPLRICLN